MIKKSARLPAEEFRSGNYRSVSTPNFVLKFKSNTIGKKRIGVVVGSRAAENAAKRNFLKRQAKAALAGINAPGKDVLVVFSKPMKGFTKKEFKAALVRAAGRAAEQ